MVTRDGRLIAQEPLPQHPTGAALCVKGRAAPEMVYNPERQLYPLRRTRPKGDPDPGWVRISWDEALDRTAEALSRISSESGAEAVAFSWTTPSGTAISDDIRWVERFTNAFGSPNVAYGTEICNWHKDYAHAYTFGRGIASPDFENTACVVLWGHNPSAAWLDHATATGAARARGAKLVVVDPRRAGFAGRADEWLRVRPGADAALALGIAGEMIRNGWFDASFVRDWTNAPMLVRRDNGRLLRAGDVAGVPDGSEPDDLVAWDLGGSRLLAYSTRTRAYRDGTGVPALVATPSLPGKDGKPILCRTVFSLYRERCEQFPPERVEELAWVPAAQVTATAKLIFKARPVTYYAWSGVGQHTNATQTDRAIATLMALTGSFDAPGGNVDFAKPKARDLTGEELLSEAQRAKSIGLIRSPLGPGRNRWVGSDMLYDAVLDGTPYPIRGVVGFGRNFLVNHANVDRGAQALAQLEFFVHADVMMTPTAVFADIFLPINTPWERDALRVGFEGSQAAENLIQLRQAVVESVGESRSDAFVVFELAKRLGLGHLFWEGDVAAGLSAMLEPLGMTLDDLRANPAGLSTEGSPKYYAYRKSGFGTPSGRVELFSETFLDAGLDPLPRFDEPASTERRKKGAFPLVLTSAKIVHYCHGQHRSIPSLRRRAPEPQVAMHPDAAAERGIAEGDLVEIRTSTAAVRMVAKFDRELDARVVSAQHGWWQANPALGRLGYDAFSDEGANFNRLVPDHEVDPVSHSTGLRSASCEISRVGNAGTGWTGWKSFRVVERRDEARDIVSFYLAPADAPTDGAALPSFRGGQHVTLRVPGPDGSPLVRCYTLSGPAGTTSYRISVKRARNPGGWDGAVSGLLHRAEDPLARVELLAPSGRFHLGVVEGTGDPVVMAAAGIGITPLLSMLHEMAGAQSKRRVHLLYGVRGEEDHAFRDELAVLGQSLPGLTVTRYRSGVNRLLVSGTDKFGRIGADALLKGAGPNSPFLLCGPSGMVEDVAAGLEAAGVAAGRIHIEAFGPSSRRAASIDAAPQRVSLARSNAGFTWLPRGRSLLEQIEAVGAKAASGCRTGQCGSCSVRLQEGTAAHPDGVTPDEGCCLPCVAVPLSPLVIDL